MDAQTKREDAEFAARMARIFTCAKLPNMAGAVEKVASDLRTAAEEPPPWTPKFKVGDRVWRIRDHVFIGVVRETCALPDWQGRVLPEGWRAMWGQCPHESELELGEPVPAPPPVPLGPEDRVRARDVVDAFIWTVWAIEETPTGIYASGYDNKGVRCYRLVDHIVRVGPPAKITPGRTVHVLDEDGKFVREGLCIDVAEQVNRYNIRFVREGRQDNAWYERHRLRLAACLKGA